MKMHQVQVPMVELNRCREKRKKLKTTSGEMVIKRAVLYFTQISSQEIFLK